MNPDAVDVPVPGEEADEWDEIFRDLLPDDPEPALEPNPEAGQDFRQLRQARAREEAAPWTPSRTSTTTRSTPYERPVNLPAQAFTAIDETNSWTQTGDYFEINMAEISQKKLNATERAQLESKSQGTPKLV
jgi:hypothetical protein